MASIFSKIAAGEIPSYKCAESDKFYAFLDISPIGKGHTLVIPRKEVDYIFDMEDEDLAEFEVFAKKVAKAIKAAFPCKKVAQVVLGLEVPHAHIHLIPMNSEADVNFRKEHLKLTEEEFKEIADKIYTEFQKSLNTRSFKQKKSCEYASQLFLYLLFIISSCLNKLFAFLHLHLVHIFTNQGRRIFFLAYQQYIVFLGNDETIQSVQYSQLAL